MKQGASVTISGHDKLLMECPRQQRTEGNDEEEKIMWKTMPLHGMHHWQIKDIADNKTTFSRERRHVYRIIQGL